MEKKVLSDLLVFGGIFTDSLKVEHLGIIAHLTEQTLSELGNDGSMSDSSETYIWAVRL